jgi:hypothetical protein
MAAIPLVGLSEATASACTVARGGATEGRERPPHAASPATACRRSSPSYHPTAARGSTRRVLTGEAHLQRDAHHLRLKVDASMLPETEKDNGQQPRLGQRQLHLPAMAGQPAFTAINMAPDRGRPGVGTFAALFLFAARPLKPPRQPPVQERANFRPSRNRAHTPPPRCAAPVAPTTEGRRDQGMTPGDRSRMHSNWLPHLTIPPVAQSFGSAPAERPSVPAAQLGRRREHGGTLGANRAEQRRRHPAQQAGRPKPKQPFCARNERTRHRSPGASTAPSAGRPPVADDGRQQPHAAAHRCSASTRPSKTTTQRGLKPPPAHCVPQE